MASMKHTYSLSNTLLAMICAEDQGIKISFLGSFDFWKKISSELNKIKGNKKWEWYGVKKGSKALPCLYPIFKKIEEEEEEEEKRFLVGFGKGSTFDISQTGMDMKMLDCLRPKPLESSSFEEKKEALIEILKSMGYSISFKTLETEGLGGYITPKTKDIVINAKSSVDQQLKTLFHEFAHGELGHGIGGDHGIEDKDRSAFEVQAESVAYILSNLIGLDTSDYTFKYILTWGKNDLEFIKSCMSKSQRVVNKVLEKLEEAGFMEVEKAA
jgi:hypothetical protein